MLRQGQGRKQHQPPTTSVAVNWHALAAIRTLAQTNFGPAKYCKREGTLRRLRIDGSLASAHLYDNLEETKHRPGPN